MKIGIPKEITPGETRVSMFPALVAAYKKETHEILIESEESLKLMITG